MNPYILDPAVQNFINANLNADINQIALSKSVFTNVSSAELASQITAKKKSEKKLPTWFRHENIFYPPALSIEQTSSETTAKYKSKLAIGTLLIDLTGGFGVDSYYFSKAVKQVIHCEINAELSQIAQHNASILNAENIEFKAVDGLELLKTDDLVFDTIYIDPARRAEKGKVFMLQDCTPDVVSNLDLLLSKAKRIIIKTAPLLDLTAGINELKYVSEIHIVSVKNECKEILWILEREATSDVKIVALTLNDTEKQFVFSRSEAEVSIQFTDRINVGQYLYEPDAALLKSGAFNLIGSRFNLQKLHPQTQLFTSADLQPKFPGRIFKIHETYSTGDLKKLKNLSGNVIVRNYPAKPEELVKKYKIKPHQEKFLIFSKVGNDENLIISVEIVQYY
ncbi:hypothetical protein DHW03_05395 [Pedobacter yonginense]|uniref:Uncharacterized protein n=1 Tax=Pedobacter yonginense TaxID=651869 RepID=A0A317EVL3_9SPHI|nr:class I SAM-dependent methyltransferase [Pedobacter yonginense]PWS29256.1 hypothetical protein DHW03_05395 [Pedobacter yonginense]